VLDCGERSVVLSSDALDGEAPFGRFLAQAACSHGAIGKCQRSSDAKPERAVGIDTLKARLCHLFGGFRADLLRREPRKDALNFVRSHCSATGRPHGTRSVRGSSRRPATVIAMRTPHSRQVIDM
jgi:hypothetical protein